MWLLRPERGRAIPSLLPHAPSVAARLPPSHAPVLVVLAPPVTRAVRLPEPNPVLVALVAVVLARVAVARC